MSLNIFKTIRVINIFYIYFIKRGFESPLWRYRVNCTPQRCLRDTWDSPHVTLKWSKYIDHYQGLTCSVYLQQNTTTTGRCLRDTWDSPHVALKWSKYKDHYQGLPCSAYLHPRTWTTKTLHTLKFASMLERSLLLSHPQFLYCFILTCLFPGASLFDIVYV